MRKKILNQLQDLAQWQVHLSSKFQLKKLGPHIAPMAVLTAMLQSILSVSPFCGCMTVCLLSQGLVFGEMIRTAHENGSFSQHFRNHHHSTSIVQHTMEHSSRSKTFQLHTPQAFQTVARCVRQKHCHQSGCSG